jgi:hypothetical protein
LNVADEPAAIVADPEPTTLNCDGEAVAELTVKAALPVFVTVTAWAELVEPTVVVPKARDVGDRLADAVPATPVPLRATAGTATAEFVENVRLPLTVATVVGAKLTEYV